MSNINTEARRAGGNTLCIQVVAGTPRLRDKTESLMERLAHV